MGLVLTRKPNQTIVIGGNIRVTVVSIVGRAIRIFVEAPPEITIHRLEIHDRIQRELAENQDANPL